MPCLRRLQSTLCLFLCEFDEPLPELPRVGATVPDAAKVQRFVVCVSALTVLENRGCEVSLVLTGVSRAVLSVAGLWRTLRHSVVARFHPGVLSPLQTQNGDDAQPLCGSAPR